MEIVRGFRKAVRNHKEYGQYIILRRRPGEALWEVEYEVPELPGYKYCPRCGVIFGSNLLEHGFPFDCAQGGPRFKKVSDAEAKSLLATCSWKEGMI